MYTLLDLLDLSDKSMIEAVSADAVSADVDSRITMAMNGLPVSKENLFHLVAMARGCHWAADVQREQEKGGESYFYIAQELLRQAVEMMGELLAIEARTDRGALH